MAAVLQDPLRPRSADAPAKGSLLALAAHVVLATGLTLGVSWRLAQPEGGEAELWASVPQVAAPPAPQPEPAPKVEPAQPPRQQVPEPPLPREADISIEKRKPEPKPEKKVEKPVEKKPEKPVEKKPEAKREPLKPVEKPAEKPAPQQPALKSARDDMMRRMQSELGDAAYTGAPRVGSRNIPGGLGVSSSYAGRVKARVKPNIVFPDVVEGNPMAEVEVRSAPDGRITARRLVKSSGVPGWDDAVLRAIDRTEILPLDENGKVPSPMVIEFKPRDF